jgi:dihydroorotate dehydrogenase (NAD+) catalytic subunit
LTLGVTLSGLELPNPLILASGILGETGKSLARVAASGAGAVTTKSIGLEPREGHPNPTVVELEYGLLNAIGLPNPGLNSYLEELDAINDIDIPVIASIFGNRIEEVEKLASELSKSGISAIEINLSCPHAEGYGASVGTDPEMVYTLTKAVKDAAAVPVFVKLTPNVSDIVKIGAAAVRAGSDGIVAINTLKAMAINIELGKPILSAIVGGYSGPAIKPIGVRCVYELAVADLGVPIIGLGGATRGEDVIEYVMAGATAVGIGTAIYYNDLDSFHRIMVEIKTTLNALGVSDLSEIRGAALP